MAGESAREGSQMDETTSQVVSVDGHRITLTHLDKVLYPETGTTKADVLGYYAAIAEVLVPHAANRAATRKRWVHGVGTPEKPEKMFFQKNLEESAPGWVQRHSIEHTDHTNVYPLVNDVATLTWLGQMSALELHVPQWQFGRDGSRRNPDRLVLDLDPGEGVTLPECADVARLARAILRDMGLDPFPVTSGSKGIHLYAALDLTHTSDEISQVAHELARALEADHPDLVVSDMKKSIRGGKVLVDWSQNNAAKTTITPYSLRGTFRPMVAMPRTWRELAEPGLAQLDYRQALSRVEHGGDPLAALLGAHDSGRRDSGGSGAGPEAGPGDPEPGAGAGAPAGDPARGDRLAAYRSKRTAGRTPEPVPGPGAGVGNSAAAGPGATAAGGHSFVIQEHHARNLHYDFRLEHEGVLASWALPRGVPTDPAKNRLAVRTEDHPLEYGAFEGVIPAGEYGAGTVSIWDSGTYDLEKWRDDEVIATLHGEPGGGLDGARRFALIRTNARDQGAHDRSAQNWLIHLMKPKAGSRPAQERTAAARTSAAQSAAAQSAAAQSVAAQTAGSESTRTTATGPGATDGEGGPGVGASPTATPADPGVRPDASPIGRYSPMLATAGSAADLVTDIRWAFEPKWDGIRALAYLSTAGTERPVRLFTRAGNDVTEAYPELLAALPDAVDAASAVLDGEIVALDRSGRPNFGLLQSRMHLTRRTVAAAAAATPVQYLVFDVLEHEGSDLNRTPYSVRRTILESLVSGDGPVQLSPDLPGDAQDALRVSRELGLEGIVAKDADAGYDGGRRSRSWIKVKHHRAQEVVIGGWRTGNGNRARSLGSLLLGIPSETGLDYIGRVGTGFRDRDLAALRSRLDTLAQAENPFTAVPAADVRDAHWVRPVLVGEVDYLEWTSDGRLRHPSWRGWRPDKAPDEVVRED
ncbi:MULTISPECIES: non-homologous end-joining DNA ligase [unclassified Cryobacterium]|uniref:non-homologous end-joining DNA ligase n=1 Tax=unclassified Cryobacterium TaxID=2649013 RepID=UPI002B23616F|nr:MULTISPECIES: non-homologous end-joining DNA ligase [unclassified Cryobacterium]MEA9998703.1 non-homologous end-joining DNA ligase [Cryobacterium sp. RTS3]MEB0266479.1 non-homologous end-joining DNA ligase [Cryobacterium sp. 10I5]